MYAQGRRLSCNLEPSVRENRTLLDHRYGCLPVVGDDEVVIGIITERDFLRFAIKQLELHDS